MSWETFVSEKLKSKQYGYKSDAKKDIVSTLKTYVDLHPEEDTYVHTTGEAKQLLSLLGTIPVNYKGTTYNIPIQIWLLTNHPFSAPLVYVRPTSSMVVKPSRHVDQAGRVYMPYLTDWRYPKSDTNGMINNLQQIFSQETPVYAKQPNVPSRPPPPASSYAFQSPGYPTQPTRMPMPGIPSSASYGGGYQNQPYPASSHPGHLPYPSYQTSPPIHQQSSPSTGCPPVSNAYQQSGQIAAIPQRQASVIEDSHLRASLLSTAEDKLKRRVKEVFQMGMMELETLENTKLDLQKGNRELAEVMEKMVNEKASLESNISMLTRKNAEADEMLRKLEADSENLNIDEAVITTAPLYNQILNLYAEENAVEDAIYYLSDALRREVIELDAYLKAVRSLSRKQFMLRATLQKARVTAGLMPAFGY